MSIKKYALKFIKLSKYAPQLVANPRAKMTLFLLGILDLVDEKCQIPMNLKDMDFSRLVTYAKQM